MAAAIVGAGFVVLNRDYLTTAMQIFAIVAVLAVALHVALHADRRELRLLLLVPTTILTWLAAVGVFTLILVGGSCSDSGDVGTVSWAGAVVIYLAGSAWSLQRPVRGVLGVPASMLAAGVWLVLTATAISGSTGACLE